MTAQVDARRAQRGDRVELGLRPEDFDLNEGDGSLDIRLRIVERLGGVTIVYGNLADGTPICASLDGGASFSGVQTVRLHYASTSLHAFDAQGAAFTRLQAPLN